MKPHVLHAGQPSPIELPPAPKAESRSGSARTTRRRALQLMGMAAAGASSWATCGAAEAEIENAKKGGVAVDALDEAYRIMQSHEPRSRRGLATHAPMVAEALCALGHPDRAVKWVENDRASLRDLPRPSAPIDRMHWREALGPKRGVNSWEASHARWGDWREFFTAELSERPWRNVLDLWTGRLAPGLSGAATHGVIRTAHAVRAIAQRETPLRRAELACGLAYWAASYEELPAWPHDGPRFETFTKALAEVPLFWDAFGRRPEGIIVDGLRGVQKLDQFAKVRDLITAPADVGAALSALTATFCRVYMRHGTKRHRLRSRGDRAVFAAPAGPAHQARDGAGGLALRMAGGGGYLLRIRPAQRRAARTRSETHARPTRRPRHRKR